MNPEENVRARDFESRRIYHSAQTPGYTSWVSFFPGERGQWYLTCEEVTSVDPPLPRCTREQYYEMSLPTGYDKSPLRMEMVILESTDDMKSWKAISRTPCRFHHSAGSFAQARTTDGRFLRFVWSPYSLDPTIASNEVFFVSDDDGKTWQKMPPFNHPELAAYPHRLRVLRDGTFVLAVPYAKGYGKGTDRPVRASRDLNALSSLWMTLYFSHDQGHSWEGPIPLYGSLPVAETDFVELPSGDLLCINNSIFAHPGRQIIYRSGKRWEPGPTEGVVSGTVPETVCLTEDGLLVGCLRNSTYRWSDDLGLTWWPLAGIPDRGLECYQPWIQHLGGGRMACAGHYGGDNPPGEFDQYLMIHFFTVECLRKTQQTHLTVERAWLEHEGRWANSYAVALTSGGRPLSGKEVECWFAERDRPGYDEKGIQGLDERMREGGELLRANTDDRGIARFDIPRLDAIRNIHYCYKLVARFNADRSDPGYTPVQSPELQFYAYCSPTDTPTKEQMRWPMG
ncbi:MAG: sialidase family protein [Candidatus Latescibacterota bacterium]